MSAAHPESVGSWAKLFQVSPKHRAAFQSAAVSLSRLHPHHPHPPVTLGMPRHSLGSSVVNKHTLSDVLKLIPGKCDNSSLFHLLDQRENELCQAAEPVLLAAVKNISSTPQSCHFIHQALLTAFLQHNLQQLRDGGLASTRLL